VIPASERMLELSEVFAGKTPLSRIEKNDMLESMLLHLLCCFLNMLFNILV
jgi:hypothetical protein